VDKTREAIEVFNNVAEWYNEKFSALDLYDDTYDLLLSLINKPNARVLELGCGPGNIAKYLLAKRTDLQILGTDLAPNMIKVAKEVNPSAQFELLDCRDVWKLKGTFDAIVIGFCMPYLPKEECEILIKDCGEKLNEKGVLYFSAIEGENKRSGYEYSSDGKSKCFVNLHEESYLQKALNENRLKTEKIFRKKYSKGNTTQTHLIIIASASTLIKTDGNSA
jgi:cyclopropane fatty-acyl-phospholipid synthase-like methyltransferase